MKKTLVFASLGGLLFAGAANAAYTGLAFEEYTNGTYEAPPGTITYRVYATFDNAMDQVTGLGGTAAEPWKATTNSVFYQDTSFGDHWAHNGNLDSAFQYLHYDSYWTIGTDDSTQGAALGIAFPGTQPTWSDTEWFADDGGVFRTPDDPLSFPVDGKVLIANLTIDVIPGGEEYIDMYVKVNGVSDDEAFNVYEHLMIPIPAPGAFALLGLAGLVSRRRR